MCNNEVGIMSIFVQGQKMTGQFYPLVFDPEWLHQKWRAICWYFTGLLYKQPTQNWVTESYMHLYHAIYKAYCISAWFTAWDNSILLFKKQLVTNSRNSIFKKVRIEVSSRILHQTSACTLRGWELLHTWCYNVTHAMMQNDCIYIYLK